MAQGKKDELIAWLRDAHAMETATVDNLERLIGRARDYPRLSSAMERHLEESRQQEQALKAQLQALGSDTSALKEAATRLIGRLEPLLSGATGDDMPKHLIAAHAWEQFEIASYQSMLGAARALGLGDLALLCERFMREEQAMAQVFFDELPAVTQDYLQHRSAA
jgi:ferritin-like metal-binding protein YciE